MTKGQELESMLERSSQKGVLNDKVPNANWVVSWQRKENDIWYPADSPLKGNRAEEFYCYLQMNGKVYCDLNRLLEKFQDNPNLPKPNISTHWFHSQSIILSGSRLDDELTSNVDEEGTYSVELVYRGVLETTRLIGRASSKEKTLVPNVIHSINQYIDSFKSDDA